MYHGWHWLKSQAPLLLGTAAAVNIKLGVSIIKQRTFRPFMFIKLILYIKWNDKSPTEGVNTYWNNQIYYKHTFKQKSIAINIHSPPQLDLLALDC